MSKLTVIHGDCLTELAKLPSESVQCCVTSPPYWGLRDYGHPGQLGLEPTPEAYVETMVRVFREVRRVLKNDGTLWLNLGDSYCPAGGNREGCSGNGPNSCVGPTADAAMPKTGRVEQRQNLITAGLKSKDLVGIPWRVAFALQADGWWLRQDIIWHKPSVMPESVTDRCTKAHEYIFLLTKSEKYFYNADAIAEPASDALYEQVEDGYSGEGQKDYAAAGVQNPSGVKARIIANARKRADRFGGNKHNGETSQHSDGSIYTGKLTRNKRSVWTVTTKPFKGAHFATYPPELITPCILAGSRIGDMVLDPFGGSGTTGEVALGLSRDCTLIELNGEYLPLIAERTGTSAGHLALHE